MNNRTRDKTLKLMEQELPIVAGVPADPLIPNRRLVD